MTEKTAFRHRPILMALGLLAALLFAALGVQPAFAFVQPDDILAGTPMEERNLPSSEGIDIVAPYACMIDNDGRIYFERSAHVPVKIASITKVMTAILAVEYGNLDDMVTVSWRAAHVGESSARLREGDRLTMRSLMRCLLIPSGNDAGVVIGEHIGAKALAEGWDLGLAVGQAAPTDPLDAFICLMNKKGRELGLEDSVFTNPHGLDDGAWTGALHSTAYDVCVMTRYAMTFEHIREVVKYTQASVPVQREGEVITLYYANTTWFISNYANATGVKTGTTDDAGYCFVGSAKEGDVELYAVALGCDDANQRFYDVRAMTLWGFAHRGVYDLLQMDETTTTIIDGEETQVPVFATVSHPLWPDHTFDVYVDTEEYPVVLFDVNGDVSQEVELADLEHPIAMGDVVGVVRFLQDGSIICSMDLIAAQDCVAPDLFTTVKFAAGRMIDKMKGRPTAASAVIANELPDVA